MTTNIPIIAITSKGYLALTGLKVRLKPKHKGALIIRIRFWGILYYTILTLGTVSAIIEAPDPTVLG